mgnify:CR=1 FL=1
MTFDKVTKMLNDTYIRKNHDYGNSFDQSIDKFGLVASAVRLSDKLNRFSTLITKKAKVNDEAIEDTVLDMANYAIMTYLYIKNHENNNRNITRAKSNKYKKRFNKRDYSHS